MKNIVSLSIQKFSSNVVEKLIECINKENLKTYSLINRKRIIDEFFNPLKIIGLIKNKYGVFVMQKIVKIMSREEKNEVRSFLKEKIAITSAKEKTYLNSFLEFLS